MQLDDLDRKILVAYQHDLHTPAQEIGETVGLSAAAVQRRLKRMRDEGVIVAEVAQLAPEQVGYPTTCIVGVKLEREGRAENKAFADAMRASTRVQQCYAVTGVYDFIVIVLSRDIADFEAFAQTSLYVPNVRTFTTFVGLDRVKVGVSTPIE